MPWAMGEDVSFPGNGGSSGTGPASLVGILALILKAVRNEASLVAQIVKNLPAMQETWVQSLGQEDPQKKGMEPTPVFLHGQFHGQRSLAAAVHEVAESDMTEQLTLSLSFIHSACVLI